MAGWDDSIFGNLPGPPLPGSPPRPKLPPNTPLAPVDPMAVIGGLYDQGAQAIGNFAGQVAGQPFPGIAPNFGLPNSDQFGRDITAMLQEPRAGLSPSALSHATLAAPVLATAAKLAPEARTAEEIATGAKAATPAAQVIPFPAPAAITRANPTPADIQAIKDSVAATKSAPWPTAQNPIFDTSPEALQRTTEVVPQTSYREQLPSPWPDTKQLPLGGRAQPIVDARGQIADRIAGDLGPQLADPTSQMSRLSHFYSTAPVLDELISRGVLDPDEAQQFMRDWAGQGAATSPRTATPQNMRNSSYLQWRRASGDPLDRAAWEQEGNAPGFPMMGMHIDLGDLFAKGQENINTNPKPTMFREGWSGNQADVTADTHNIRATLYNYDQLNPGQLPSSWFTKPGYQDYQAAGGFKPNQGLDVGAIKDTLESQARGGVSKQVEYGVMADPWYDAAQKLGISPAQAQAAGWFNYGPITGLRSPPKILPDLLNDQIEHTSRVLGVSPQHILNWWGQRKIPLAENTAPGTTLNNSGVG